MLARQIIWQKKNRRRTIREGDLVSIKIPHSQHVAEYMWFIVVFSTNRNKTFVGALRSKPLILNMVLGEELQFEREEIIDLKATKQTFIEKLLS